MPFSKVSRNTSVWTPFFKAGDHVKVLSGQRGESPRVAVCLKFVRPTPFLGMEQWIVRFEDTGIEARVNLLEENKVR